MDIYDSKIRRRLRPTDGSADPLAERVEQLRELFKREFDDNCDLYDRRDLERFLDQEDDWHARRWIIYQRDLELAFQLLKDTMRWRKQMDLNDLNFEDFPREFYECGCVFEYGQDKAGRQVLYIRCRLFKPMSDLNALYDKYFAFMVDQCDKRSKSRGFSMLYDVTDAGLSNVEMILIAGLPWVLMPVFKLVMSLIPASHAAAFKLIGLNELGQYIEDDQIPTSMGGTSKAKFQKVPVKARSAIEFADLSEATATKLKKHVESKTDPNEYEEINSMRVIR